MASTVVIGLKADLQKGLILSVFIRVHLWLNGWSYRRLSASNDFFKVLSVFIRS